MGEKNWRAELSDLSLKRNSGFEEINLLCHVIAQSRGSINAKKIIKQSRLINI